MAEDGGRGAPGSPFGPAGSWLAAKSVACSEPLRTSSVVSELSRRSVPESDRFLTFEAVTAFVASLAPVTACVADALVPILAAA